MPTERMFVAVTPPPEVIGAIADLPTKPLRGVRYTRRKQWHITVCFLGDCERNEALAAFAGLSAPSAQVTLGPRVSLLGDRIVMLPVSGLDELAAQVGDAFRGVGDPVDHSFTGHLTLARLRGLPLREPDRVSVLGAPISVTFLATGIDLYSSEPGPDGAAHTLVATQPLA